MTATHILNNSEYMEKINEYKINPWYMKYLGLVPRGFMCGDNIYINNDAFYINKQDRDLLIQHEIYHTEGYNHTWFGVMSAYSIIRWLTTL